MKIAARPKGVNAFCFHDVQRGTKRDDDFNCHRSTLAPCVNVTMFFLGLDPSFVTCPHIVRWHCSGVR